MLFRRSRQHQHGSSNKNLLKHFTHTSSESNKNHTKTAPIISFKQNNKIEFNSIQTKKWKTKQLNLRVHTSQNRYQKPQQIPLCEDKIKKVYKNRKNIVKLLQQWGFTEKGKLCSDDFIKKIEQRLLTNIQESEKVQILKKYKNPNNQIDIPNFLSFIYGTSDGVIIDQNLFNPNQQSNNRDKLITNLRQNLKQRCYIEKKQISLQTVDSLISKINQSIRRIIHKQVNMINNKQQFFNQITENCSLSENQKQMLSKVKQKIQFPTFYQKITMHKSIDSLIYDPLMRIVKKQNKHQHNKQNINNNNFDKFHRKSQLVAATTDQIMNSALFHQKVNKKNTLQPSLFYEIDQRKTRFCDKHMSQENGGWRANTAHQSVRPNQKYLLLEALNAQKQNKKNRKQLKLIRLQDYRAKQQEIIRKNEQKALSKEAAKLKSLKQQQQAYNYVNFIKKRWD